MMGNKFSFDLFVNDVFIATLYRDDVSEKTKWEGTLPINFNVSVKNVKNNRCDEDQIIFAAEKGFSPLNSWGWAGIPDKYYSNDNNRITVTSENSNWHI